MLIVMKLLLNNKLCIVEIEIHIRNNSNMIIQIYLHSLMKTQTNNPKYNQEMPNLISS